MKIFKSIYILVFCCAVLNASGQQLPENSTWEGKILGIPLTLKIKFDSLSKKQIAEFDSPTQGAVGLKVSDLKLYEDSLTAISAVIGGGFKGKFNEDNTEVVGKWMQGGQQWPMTLIRVANKEALKRPQMPKAPFPYTSTDVIYYNTNHTIKYGATLTIPKSGKLIATVILITGSGPEDRDETIFGHKPFWVIADYLSRNGIAVLRVDDRGVGQSTGDMINATSLDFAKDVIVGIDFLKKQPKLKQIKIGLIGHSEGGMIAPMVANQSNDVAFIISMAGVGIKGDALLWKQQADGLKASGVSASDQRRLLSLTEMMMQLSDNHPKQEDLKLAFNKNFEQWIAAQPLDFLKRNGFEDKEVINNLAAKFYMPWMRYFISYDPALTLSKITIPVLAINGEKDVQVNAKENLAGFKKYLDQSGNKKYKIVSFPNLNHLFQHANTGEVSEYVTIEETISPEVLKVISEWIAVQ